MNRFAYDNIDQTLTAKRREMALTMRASKRKRQANRKPAGYDQVAGKALEIRVKDFNETVARVKADQRMAYTKPGSMQRH